MQLMLFRIVDLARNLCFKSAQASLLRHDSIRVSLFFCFYYRLVPTRTAPSESGTLGETRSVSDLHEVNKASPT